MNPSDAADSPTLLNADPASRDTLDRARTPDASGLPDGVRVVAEVSAPESVPPHYIHPLWAESFPWLSQGTTARGNEATPYDMALFGEDATGAVSDRWSALRQVTGAGRLVHGRQVHGPVVRVHGDGAPGLHVSPGTDGHVTRTPGVLLTVATADCVPVSLVDPVRRGVGLLHGGWRGVAAGVVERGIEVLSERMGSRPGDLYVHLGPAICGRCYEVGPEVHDALGLPHVEAACPIDLRAVISRRVVGVGVKPGRVTVSSLCTRCEDAPFFSHRGGDVGRQVAFLGVRVR